jgi:hypothetical protein
MAKRVKQRRADVACAWCGKPLDLLSMTTNGDGLTVCGADCLGAALARVPEEDRSPIALETVSPGLRLPTVAAQWPAAQETAAMDNEGCGSWFGNELPD